MCVNPIGTPIPNLYLGEITNGSLERTLNLPHADKFFLICKTNYSLRSFNGSVQILNENQANILAFDFYVKNDSVNPKAGQVFYLAPRESSNVAFRKDQIQGDKITLSIKLDSPNKEPIQVRLAWPKTK